MALIYENDRVPGENMSEFLVRLGVEALEDRHEQAMKYAYRRLNELGKLLEARKFEDARQLRMDMAD